MYDLFRENKSRIEFEFCNNNERNKVFRDIVNKHHQYMDYKDTCNRRLNWLVFETVTGNLIGAIGINSAILALGERDNFIGWNRELKSKNIVMLANNYRFALIKENITIKYAGTQTLKMLRQISPTHWLNRYGDRLVMLESLVKPPWVGTVYRADNWIFVGMTKGFSFSKAPVASWQKESGRRGYLARTDKAESIRRYAVQGKAVAVERTEPKMIFLKPLIKNWQKVLCNGEPAKEM